MHSIEIVTSLRGLGLAAGLGVHAQSIVYSLSLHVHPVCSQTLFILASTMKLFLENYFLIILLFLKIKTKQNGSFKELLMFFGEPFHNMKKVSN